MANYTDSPFGTLIHMLVHRFIDLQEDEQEQEIGKLSNLLGEHDNNNDDDDNNNNNNNVSILKQPDETEYDFNSRSFSELLHRLQPDSLKSYKISFFGTHGAPTDIDRLIRQFIQQPVEKQEEEIRKLLGLTGGESVPKSAEESEEDLRIRSFFEMLLKLNVDSVEDYKTSFYETYGKPRIRERRSFRQCLKLKLDVKAPPGFNRDYKPPPKKD